MHKLSYSIIDNDLINAIKIDKEWAINHLYVKYKTDAISYLKAKGADEKDALTCYHETIMIVIEHIKDGILDSNSGSILPYLKTVGKIQWLNLWKSKNFTKEKEEQFCSSLSEDQVDILTSLVENEESSQRLECLKRAMGKLKEKCIKIISLTFLQIPPLGNEDVAPLVGLRNGNSVGVTKSRCIKTLKEYFLDIYNTKSFT